MKHAMAKFLDFNMVDSKPIMEQVDALELLKDEIAYAGVLITDMFMVNYLCEKLPPSWVGFKEYLFHKTKAISLEDLIVKLRVESQIRNIDVNFMGEKIVDTSEH